MRTDQPKTITPRRIQRQRVEGWRMPPGAVYVGRPSKRGNPWRVKYEGKLNGWVVIGPEFLAYPTRHYCSSERVARRFAVWKFRRWARSDFARKRLDLVGIKGHDLACWCGLDEPCHADVLLELANG